MVFIMSNPDKINQRKDFYCQYFGAKKAKKETKLEKHQEEEQLNNQTKESEAKGEGRKGKKVLSDSKP